MTHGCAARTYSARGEYYIIVRPVLIFLSRENVRLARRRRRGLSSGEVVSKKTIIRKFSSKILRGGLLLYITTQRQSLYYFFPREIPHNHQRRCLSKSKQCAFIYICIYIYLHHTTHGQTFQTGFSNLRRFN